jgi:hypothetical protein
MLIARKTFETMAVILHTPITSLGAVIAEPPSITIVLHFWATEYPYLNVIFAIDINSSHSVKQIPTELSDISKIVVLFQKSIVGQIENVVE